MRGPALIVEQRVDEKDTALAVATIKVIRARLDAAEAHLLSTRMETLAAYAAAFERVQVLRNVLEDVQSVTAKYYDV